MRVSVFGVGYVGCVTAACLAREGHEVIGVDIDTLKIRSINEGRSPFFEPGLQEVIQEMVAAKRLRATADHADAVRQSEIALICVGTPSSQNGSSRLDYLRHVFSTIGDELQKSDDYYVVALRSTVLPASFERELIPLLEQRSGRHIGKDIGFVYNPEFLREGAALKDFYEPPWTIIGSNDVRAGDLVAHLYQSLPAPIVRTNARSAVLVKYFSNVFHALKIVFGNEVGSLCRELGVDAADVMNIFCRDSKLNISPQYLRPGFAFGGSCLPKDIRALVSEASARGLDLPILKSILPSNEMHLDNCVRLVASASKHKVGIVGLSFKAHTDDLRESPAVELAERLIGKGFDVRIYEPSIKPETVHGANRRFIEQSIPHIWKLLVSSLNQLIEHAEAVVLTQQLTKEERRSFTTMAPGKLCIDLARTLSAAEMANNYWAMDRPRCESRESVLVG